MSRGHRQEAISLDDEELAVELRKQTAMSMGWIAREHNAGAPKCVWNAMRSFRTGVKLEKESNM